MKLADLYQALVIQAHTTGQDAARTLPKGARVAVRVRGRQTVTFSRLTAPLGEMELTTFITHCAIPSAARRIPPELGKQGHTTLPSGLTRYYVAYTWLHIQEPEQQAFILPNAPQPRMMSDDLFPEPYEERTQ